MFTLVFTILIFLLLSAFFSGSEIAFISANKLKIEVQKEEQSRIGRILSGFYASPKDFLGTMLVGNNIALVILTYLMTKLLEPWVLNIINHPTIVLFIITIVITIIVLIFGEFFPKTFFTLYANKLLALLAYPLLFFKFLLYIPSKFMTGLSTFILKNIFRTKEDEDIQPFSRLDLQNMIQTGLDNDLENEIDADLFTNALHLKTTKLKDAMIPRNEIKAIDVKDSVETLKQIIDQTKLSRILVYEDDIENVQGYIHHRQILDNPQKIRPLILELSFVPEAMTVIDLLNRFIQKGENIACVVDEFGGVAGLVTLEDLLEEIFGDIEDEHDDDEDQQEIQLSESEWLLSGRLEVDYLNDKYDHLVIPASNDYTTLSGMIVKTAEKIPEEGLSFIIGQFEYTLEKVLDTRIELIRVNKISEEQ